MRHQLHDRSQHQGFRPCGADGHLGQTGPVTIGTAPVPTRPPKARRRRKPATPTQILSITAICTLAGVLAAISSDASPTANPLLDAMWRTALVTLCTVAGSRARRWSLVVAAGMVTIGAADWWSLAGLAAIATTFGLAWDGRRNRILGAVAGALIGLTALHMGWPTTTFATAAVGAVAVGIVCASAYRTSGRRVRRRVRIGATVAGSLALVGIAGAVAFGLTQRSNLQQAIDEASSAADDISASSTAASTEGFADARTRLDRVVGAADAPWMVVTRAVPVLGANVSSIRDAAAAGSELARSAENLAGRVDYDRMQLPGGGIDLAVLRSFSGPVADTETALATAKQTLTDADSPFVLGPVADRMAALRDRVSAAHTAAITARLGVEAAPGLLGADAPRRYLLLLGNPAEARDLGGHLGNWAEITTEGGQIDVVRVGAPYELFGPTGPGRPFLPDTSGYPRSLLEMSPTRFPQNWGATPDLPTVARLAAQLYPQTKGGAPLDGVIYADPTAFAAALSLTGPATVPGTSITIDASNAAEFLERGQYAAFERESQGDEAVTDLVRDVLDRLLEGPLPSPHALATAFGPAVEGGHLKFITLHDADSAFLRRLRVDGAVRAEKGDDLLAVISRNANPSKIDSYLERTIDHRVTWDPGTGEIRSQVVVTLTNTAPATGLAQLVGLPPPGGSPGTNRTELAVLTPLSASGATIDGVRTPIGTRDDLPGLRRHTLSLDLAPGQSRTVVFDLSGQLAGPDYRLRWIGQPLANPDEAQLTIRSTGARFVGDVEAGSLELTQGDHDVTVRVER